MSLFGILKGESSRISTDITPFHNGWCYFTTDDGGFYIDAEDENNNRKRTHINPKSKPVPVTLYASAWEDGRQTVVVEGLTKEQNGYIGLPHEITGSQFEAARDAELRPCAQEDGKLTIMAYGDSPKIDIPAVVILLG